MIYKINASSDAFFCAQTVPKVEKLHGYVMEEGCRIL